MKVVHILPGSGGTFYCENCMRDSSLVRALRAEGHDVVLVPMYLPIYTDDRDVARDVPVFFGGINVYLQQQVPFFRKTPRWLDALFDARWLLGLAARKAGATRAAGLGKMTLSMLRGPDGNQAKELDRLTAWLGERGRPDVIHVSSVLLLGLAGALKEALGAPVVFTAMDEDVWVDELEDAYPEACWAAMREQARGVDAFVTVSDYYRRVIGERLAIPDEKLHVVRIGIDTDGYAPASADPSPPALGFLSRMGAGLGLDVLVDAFIALRERGRTPDLRLRAMGGATGDDRAFLDALRRRLARHGLDGAADFLPELEREARIAFLKSVSVLSVPIPGGEAFGTFILEALAAGVPVVQPQAAGFTELVEITGGGLLYDPAAPAGLPDALERLLLNRDQARALGRRGREAVMERFTVQRMARETLDVYRRILPQPGGPSTSAA